MNASTQIADERIRTAGWRTARADAFGWLVDGDAYFGAVRDALDAARHEVLIVGWDIDSRVELVRDPDDPRYPSPLCETLQALIDEQPGLHVNVLSWDFAAIYMLERELFPALAFGWGSGERLHFELDGQHTTGASHHQKLVIVDNALAFVGGFDLTKCRWDTRAHAPDDDRRVDTSGTPYRPFHDVQAVMTGAIVASLRDLFAARWNNATGKRLPDCTPGDAERLWPTGTARRAGDVDVTIARTWAAPDGGEVVREVEATYLEMIGAARQWIYLENQYFTSHRIVEALATRLAADDAPETVIVLPHRTSGWLEQATMEMRRNHAISTLRDADVRERLRVVAPVQDGHEAAAPNVHSKLAVVDGRWLRIGSANLSNRSMGLDSECDVIVEAPGAARALTADLLAEHLGGDADDIETRLERDGLFAAIDDTPRTDRRLSPLDVDVGDFDALLEPLASIADMERPITRTASGEAKDAQEEQEDAAPGAEAAKGGWWFLAVLVALGGGWLYLAIGGDDAGVDLPSLLRRLRGVAGHPVAPLAMIAVIVLGSLVVTPITGLIAVCGLLFPPWIATATAISGALLATWLNHAIGARFGARLMQRVPDAVTRRLQRLASASDLWSLAALRLIPIAPFSIINLAAGAAGVRRLPLLLGTLVGMGPGAALICLSVDRARAALAGDSVFDPLIIASIGAVAALFLVLRIRSQRGQEE